MLLDVLPISRPPDRSRVPSLIVTEVMFHAELASEFPQGWFLGPTIRGLLGHVLKDLVCHMPHRECDRCVLRQACPYPFLFDGVPPPTAFPIASAKIVPQPFTLVTPALTRRDGATRQLQWGLRLFGHASQYVPYFIEAFVRAGERGLGRYRIPFRITEVRDPHTGAVLFRDGDAQLGIATSRRLAPGASEIFSPGADDRLRWRFLTPMHIREQGAMLEDVDGLSLVIAGRRRWQLLCSMHGQPSDPGSSTPEDPVQRLERDAFRVTRRCLERWSIDRFSGRQQRRVRLQGWVGEIDIEGPWSLAGSWLHVVRETHLGKYASFGFGSVEWELQ